MENDHEFSVAKSIIKNGSGLHSQIVNKSQISAVRQRTSAKNTGMKSYKNLPDYKPQIKSNSRFFLVVAMGLISLLGLSVAAKKYQNSKRAIIKLSLSTQPNHVKVKINGTFLNKGRYNLTPLQGKLVIGKNTIVISREGYRTEQIKLNLNSTTSSKKLKVSLKKTARFSPIKIRIGDTSYNRIKFNIDQGMETGFAPVKIKNLTYGKTHTMKVFLDQRNYFTCKFQPRSRSWRKPFIIAIYPKSKRCEYKKP
jgi:hypothetical protein